MPRCSSRRASAGPAAAPITFPAKYTPGTEMLSQYGVCAGSRPSLTIATPIDGRSRTGARKPVAAITSSLSSSTSPSHVVPLARMR